MAIAYINGIIYSGHGRETGKAILTNNGIIHGIVDADKVEEEYTIKDLGGLNIAPSLIDLQIYGGNGLMFSTELTTEAISATYEYCLSGGCSHFMITMATNTIEKFLRGMEVVREYWVKGGKGLLGLHMEGPYLNPVKRGAHILDCIKKPEMGEVEMILAKGKDVLKMITIAPELCEERIIKLLLDHHLIVSAGHTNATFVEGKKGFALGIPTSTHLFNAMSAFQSREPGMVGAIYDDEKAKSSVVADGIHVDFAAVRISKRQMGKRLFLITDAVAEVLHGEYQHIFKGDRYTLPDGTLSGSSLTMMKAVQNCVEKIGIDLEEALRMASTYPAQLLKHGPKLGKIETGYVADFVVFDNAFQVKEMILS